MAHHIERKISFPVEAVFQSAVHECDNSELWKVLRTYSRCILDLNETNHSGLTALHISVLNKNLDGVKMLLCSGADPDVPDENGYTPLHTASSVGLLQVRDANHILHLAHSDWQNVLVEFFYRPHLKDGGRYCFQFVCQSTP